MKNLFLPAIICLALGACSNPETAADAAGPATASPAAPDAMAEPDAAPAPVDYRSYAQYVACRIDGQPYLAYYAPGHTSNLSNPVNMASRTDFATSADQEPLNGDTKISELHFLFFNLAKKGVGTYTSPADFHVDGHTAFAKGAGLEEVHFVVAAGQQLSVSSLEDGAVEGRFSFEAVDENDKSRTLKITDGHFKMALAGGVKEISKTPDGDVDMNKLMKDVMK